MNRLGMLIDLSHTSDDAVIQAIQLSRAPVMWSHSSARAVWNVSRNVPDEILKMIGRGEGKRDGVVMVLNFFFLKDAFFFTFPFSFFQGKLCSPVCSG